MDVELGLMKLEGKVNASLIVVMRGLLELQEEVERLGELRRRLVEERERSAKDGRARDA